MKEINFTSLIGGTVTVLSKSLDPSLGPVNVVIRGVDVGGIWIESQHLTDIILKALNQTVFEATPVFFLPFSAIFCAIAQDDVPSISSEGIAG